MRARFASQYGVNVYEAVALTASRETARYFEDSVAAGAAPKFAATWVMGEVSAALNRDEIDIGAAPVAADALARLLARIDDGTVSGKIAKQSAEAMKVRTPAAMLGVRGTEFVVRTGQPGEVDAGR